MIEKDAYRAEKEAREKRLMAYSDRIQNRMMEASSEIIGKRWNTSTLTNIRSGFVKFFV